MFFPLCGIRIRLPRPAGITHPESTSGRTELTSLWKRITTRLTGFELLLYFPLGFFLAIPLARTSYWWVVSLCFFPLFCGAADEAVATRWTKWSTIRIIKALQPVELHRNRPHRPEWALFCLLECKAVKWYPNPHRLVSTQDIFHPEELLRPTWLVLLVLTAHRRCMLVIHHALWLVTTRIPRWGGPWVPCLKAEANPLTPSTSAEMA